MQKPERSSYSADDFLSWKATGQLEISPRFQRRKVWGPAARSYLIDTLLLGYPVPPIYIRITRKRGSQAPIREIVDGQQRISAALDYIKGDYPLSSNIESPYSGKKFAELPQGARDKISTYSFICEVFQGISDQEVLSVFARLNTYSVRLNAQELRNGRFFGPFKQSSYELGYSHLTFWRNNKIFSELAIARMQEVELTSELLVAMLHGMQDKKKSIDEYYKRYDQRYVQRRTLEKKFKRVIDEISEAVGDTLKGSEFRRTPLFYSLFLAIAHRMYGVPGVRLRRSGGDKIAAPERAKIKQAVLDLSKIVKDARNDIIKRGYAQFIGASLRQTDNIKPRQTRLDTIYHQIFG